MRLYQPACMVSLRTGEGIAPWGTGLTGWGPGTPEAGAGAARGEGFLLIRDTMCPGGLMRRAAAA
jgi:hypothetical protein